VANAVDLTDWMILGMEPTTVVGLFGGLVLAITLGVLGWVYFEPKRKPRQEMALLGTVFPLPPTLTSLPALPPLLLVYVD
jgi:hypothetical protein